MNAGRADFPSRAGHPADPLSHRQRGRAASRMAAKDACPSSPIPSAPGICPAAFGRQERHWQRARRGRSCSVSSSQACTTAWPRTGGTDMPDWTGRSASPRSAQAAPRPARSIPGTACATRDPIGSANGPPATGIHVNHRFGRHRRFRLTGPDRPAGRRELGQAGARCRVRRGHGSARRHFRSRASTPSADRGLLPAWRACTARARAQPGGRTPAGPPGVRPPGPAAVPSAWRPGRAAITAGTAGPFLRGTQRQS